MHMKMRIALIFCCILLLCACQRQAPGKGKIIRFDLPAPIVNLDPQFATDAYSRMIISNLYEGLMTYDENGQLILGAAESVEVSGGDTVFFFKLRQNTQWKDGKPLTAHDFVFAFKRMFAADAPSPFAADYIAIANAEKILESTTPPGMLGVEAKSDYELIITLEHASPFFPALLAETPAMPCNQAAFEEARGRYGLEKDLVSANGPFYLNRWDNEATIRLLPNPNYQSDTAVAAGGVYFRVAPEASTLERLLDGDADIAILSHDEGEKAKAQGFATTEFQDTVWCVVFDQGSDLWGNPLLRQGLAHVVDRGMFRDNLPAQLTAANLLVPPANLLANEAYREIAQTPAIDFDVENGARLYQMGLSSLGIDNITGSSFYVPDSTAHMLAMSAIQQNWQKYLSAYVNLMPLPEEELERRFWNRDFDIMLAPIRSDAPAAQDFFSNFTTGAKANRPGYQNELYDSRVAKLSRAETLQQAAAECAIAESTLLRDVVAIPIYYETSVFATASNVIGIHPTTYVTRLNFKYMEK